MTNIDHPIAAPEGWPAAWVQRQLPALNWYIAGVSALLCCAMFFIMIRGILSFRRVRVELAANPSDRAAIFKRIEKRMLKTTRGHFKIALAYLANTIIIILVDGLIAVFVLAKDVSEHTEVWDTNMVMAVGVYCVYLLLLFVASFILVPLVQMLVVTWALTRVSKKNTLHEYVPFARYWSTIIGLIWAMVAFTLVARWPIIGNSDNEDMRFVALEAVWGSTLAWLEASFIFNYLSHAIGNKELNRGNGVGEMVSMFAKTATVSFRKSKEDVLPRYEEVAQGELMDNEKQASGGDCLCESGR